MAAAQQEVEILCRCQRAPPVLADVLTKAMLLSTESIAASGNAASISADCNSGPAAETAPLQNVLNVGGIVQLIGSFANQGVSWDVDVDTTASFCG